MADIFIFIITNATKSICTCAMAIMQPPRRLEIFTSNESIRAHRISFTFFLLELLFRCYSFVFFVFFFSFFSVLAKDMEPSREGKRIAFLFITSALLSVQCTQFGLFMSTKFYKIIVICVCSAIVSPLLAIIRQ